MKNMKAALLSLALILGFATGLYAEAKSCCNGQACCNGQNSCCHRNKAQK